jgi:hypothetical protein
MCWRYVTIYRPCLHQSVGKFVEPCNKANCTVEEPWYICKWSKHCDRWECRNDYG